MAVGGKKKEGYPNNSVETSVGTDISGVVSKNFEGNKTIIVGSITTEKSKVTSFVI